MVKTTLQTLYIFEDTGLGTRQTTMLSAVENMAPEFVLSSAVGSPHVMEITKKSLYAPPSTFISVRRL